MGLFELNRLVEQRGLERWLESRSRMGEVLSQHGVKRPVKVRKGGKTLAGKWEETLPLSLETGGGLEKCGLQCCLLATAMQAWLGVSRL